MYPWMKKSNRMVSLKIHIAIFFPLQIYLSDYCMHVSVMKCTNTIKVHFIIFSYEQWTQSYTCIAMQKLIIKLFIK
jgi:hypothetical protein